MKSPTLPKIATNRTKIQQLIRYKYKQSQQQLLLNGCVSDWKDVILFRNWSELRSLWLAYCKIDDPGVMLLSNREWPNLQSLQFGNNQITAVGLKHLFKNKFPKLKKLFLWKNMIGDSGMEYLITKAQLTQLEIFNAGFNQITAEGLRNFPNSRFLKLKELHLWKNNIGYKGIQLLTKSELPLLEGLWLANTKLGNEGSKCLTKGIWPHLNYLNLMKNKIGHDGVSALRHNSCQSLTFIDIYDEESLDTENNYSIIGIFQLIVSKRVQSNLQICYDVSDTNFQQDINNIFERRRNSK